MGNGAIQYCESVQTPTRNQEMSNTKQSSSNQQPFKTTTEARARRIVYRTHGRAHGPITRLVSPSDVGEFIKPFVFLDYFDIDPKHTPAIGFHPHSGIATLTLLLEG